MIVYIVCAIVGLLLNMRRKYNSQMSYALSNNSIWPGEIWWIKNNWRAVFWNVLILGLLFFIFRPLLSGNVLKNGDAGIEFGMFLGGQNLAFEIPTMIVFDIFIAITAYGMGYAGSDQLISWLSGSSPIIKAAISQNSPNDPNLATPMPPPTDPPAHGDGNPQ